jgi:hypothetical protein
MYTWIYYEFVNTVHFPNDRACARAEMGTQFTVAERDPVGVTFKCGNDQGVFVPWANVRYIGGIATPQLVPSEPAPAPIRKPKK